MMKEVKKRGSQKHGKKYESSKSEANYNRLIPTMLFKEKDNLTVCLTN